MRSKILLFLCFLLTVSISSPYVNKSQSFAESSTVDNGSWSFVGQNQQNTWYSSQDAIGPSNVGNLKLAWFSPLQGTAGTPVISGGLVYVTGAPIIEALNEDTGSVVWSDGPPDFNFSTDAGVTIDSGNLFAATANGYLLSLNALTGALNWNVSVIQSIVGNDYAYSGPQAAALVYNGEVIVSETRGDLGSRGFVRAFSETSGSLLWTFYTVPPDPITSMNQGNYSNSWAPCATCSGGDVWGVPALDPNTGLIYFGTGDPYPEFNSSLRSQTPSETNLYTDSVLALNSENGELVWFHQITPYDVHDWDQGVPVQLFNTTINGVQTEVVGSGGKSGYYSLLDASNGNLLYSISLGIHMNDAADATPQGVIVYPGDFGGINSFSSYDPQTNLIYTMAYNRPGNFSATPNGITDNPPSKIQENSTLYALNASTSSVVWSSTFPELGGGASSTNGLVFTSDAAGVFYALNASSGAVLWQYSTNITPLSFLWNWGPPAIVDGMVFETVYGVNGGNAGVYAFAPQTSTTTTSTASTTSSTTKTSSTSTTASISSTTTSTSSLSATTQSPLVTGTATTTTTTTGSVTGLSTTTFTTILSTSTSTSRSTLSTLTTSTQTLLTTSTTSATVTSTSTSFQTTTSSGNVEVTQTDIFTTLITLIVQVLHQLVNTIIKILQVNIRIVKTPVGHMVHRVTKEVK